MHSTAYTPYGLLYYMLLVHKTMTISSIALIQVCVHSLLSTNDPWRSKRRDKSFANWT